MRYRITLSYDGASFCGWQLQPHSPSVQQCLEEALSRLTGTRVAVTGAGRTDTGVNAVNYVAHFDLDRGLPFPQPDFCYKLNAILPRSIVVQAVVPERDDFHARFDARRRFYTYFIHRRKDPFVEAYSWRCGYPGLDFGAMNRAARALLGTHDFSCFEKTGGANKTSICTVYEAYWEPYTPSHVAVMGLESGTTGSETCATLGTIRGRGPLGRGREATVSDPVVPDSVLVPESNYWYFRISADRFLRNMVRAIVGTLIEVGRGKQEEEWVARLVTSGTRSDAGESVPGHALFLNRVEY